MRLLPIIHRYLVKLGITIGFIALAFILINALAGCASRVDPRDPEIWRPTTPAVYPLPE